MTTKKILVKIEYHGQVWYEVQEHNLTKLRYLTMGQTHARVIIQESNIHPRQDVGRQVQERDNLRIEVKPERCDRSS